MKTFNLMVLVPMAATVAVVASPAWANAGSVVTGDTASFRLQMFGDLGTTRSINAGGNVNVLRGPSAVSLGLNQNGGTGASNIMCKWDEIDNPNNPATRLVVAELWTVGREDMMPFGVTHNGEVFSFWTWNVGTSNPVSFVNNSSVQLFSARVQMIRVEVTGSQTVLANQAITDLGSSWSGVDDGQTKTLTGQGMNLVRLTYEIEAVPGPAAGALAGLAGLAAARRRRR